MSESEKVKPPFYVEDIFVGKEFQHFLINPQKGIVKKRGDVSLTSRFSRNITLDLPIVSANMDTVTGPEMCIAMARVGGIGILPRSDSISIEQQIEWVRQVKRAENFIIESPYTILETATIGQARREMELRKVGTLLAVDKNSCLAGMLESRKIRLCSDADLVEDWMAKVMGRELPFTKRNISTPEEAKKELNRFKTDKLPIIDKDHKIRGLVTNRDIAELEKNLLANKDEKGRLRVGAAIGATGDYLERAAALIDFDVDVIVIDIAHGHSTVMEEAVINFRRRFSHHELVCGNVATFEGAKFLKDLGVDGIKVGLGSGFGCLTRRKTGVGVGQIHAVRAAWHAVGGDIPIISDGGVREEGDINKALAVGASSVMLGSFLAGTEETPGEFVPNPETGARSKSYRGMTSPQAKLESAGSLKAVRNVEGKEESMPYRGSVKDILDEIQQDMQSMVSYAGELTLGEARNKLNTNPLRYLIPSS